MEDRMILDTKGPGFESRYKRILPLGLFNANAAVLIQVSIKHTRIPRLINSFSADLFKVDFFMFKIVRLHFSCNKSLYYFDN